MLEPSRATVELPAVLDLRAAAPLADQLLALRGEPLTIDASKVDRIGGQCLQVLMSAAATWAADGASLQIAAPSEAFESGLELLGLSTNRLLSKDFNA